MSWPLFASLRGYDRGWLRGDVVAGLTVWAVPVPEALAYATIAGVSPVIGLYAAPGALLLYAAFGSSRHLVTGPMSATAALSAAAVAELATQGSSQFVQLTTALAVTTGIAALLAGLLRLGFLASFISEPVLKGFIIGLALTIIAGQLPKLFGVEGTGGDFFEKIAGLLGDLGGTQGLTLAVGLASLDLRMPRLDGVQATRRLRDHDPEVAVIALTTYADDRSVVEALRAGARGYLTKDAGAEEIRRALEAVVGGEVALDPAVQRHLVDALAGGAGGPGPAAPALPDGLTPREAEVLALIAEGLTNAEIAARLVVSEATVKSHVNHLLAKIGARDRAQAVAYAYRHHLAP